MGSEKTANTDEEGRERLNTNTSPEMCLRKIDGLVRVNSKQTIRRSIYIVCLEGLGYLCIRKANKGHGHGKCGEKGSANGMWRRDRS